ncbi:hypothetical protein Tco_0114195, partial [Tanacetum coccineum]
MATMAENVIVAGSENCPPMLEKDSIDNGPFTLKPVITVKDTDGTTDITYPQTVEDLTPQEKLRYDCDIKAVNILLIGLQLTFTL